MLIVLPDALNVINNFWLQEVGYNVTIVKRDTLKKALFVNTVIKKLDIKPVT